jgi:hypothetical protein
LLSLPKSVTFLLVKAQSNDGMILTDHSCITQKKTPVLLTLCPPQQLHFNLTYIMGLIWLAAWWSEWFEWVNESHLIFHGYDRVWFPADSTTRFATATIKAAVQRWILGHKYYFQPVIRTPVANNKQKVSPYLKENTRRLHYKENQVNYV